VTPHLLAVANIGDSRAVLLSSSVSVGTGGKEGSSTLSSSETTGTAGDGGEVTLVATPLSFDHKPELPAERARVERAGGWECVRVCVHVCV
jgi:hypothetical protein